MSPFLKTYFLGPYEGSDKDFIEQYPRLTALILNLHAKRSPAAQRDVSSFLKAQEDLLFRLPEDVALPLLEQGGRLLFPASPYPLKSSREELRSLEDFPDILLALKTQGDGLALTLPEANERSLSFAALFQALVYELFETPNSLPQGQRCLDELFRARLQLLADKQDCRAKGLSRLFAVEPQRIPSLWLNFLERERNEGRLCSSVFMAISPLLIETFQLAPPPVLSLLKQLTWSLLPDEESQSALFLEREQRSLAKRTYETLCTLSYEELTGHRDLFEQLISVDFCPNYPSNAREASATQRTSSYLQNGATIVYYSTPGLEPAYSSLSWLHRKLTSTQERKADLTEGVSVSSLSQLPSLAFSAIHSAARKAYLRSFITLARAAQNASLEALTKAAQILPLETPWYLYPLQARRVLSPITLSGAGVLLSLTLNTYRTLKGRAKQAFMTLQRKLQEDPEQGILFCQEHLNPPPPPVKQFENEGIDSLARLCYSENIGAQELLETFYPTLTLEEEERKKRDLFFNPSAKNLKRENQDPLYLLSLCQQKAPGLLPALKTALLKKDSSRQGKQSRYCTQK